jgi:hypothetical protein
VWIEGFPSLSRYRRNVTSLHSRQGCLERLLVSGSRQQSNISDESESALELRSGITTVNSDLVIHGDRGVERHSAHLPP